MKSGGSPATAIANSILWPDLASPYSPIERHHGPDAEMIELGHDALVVISRRYSPCGIFRPRMFIEIDFTIDSSPGFTTKPITLSSATDRSISLFGCADLID